MAFLNYINFIFVHKNFKLISAHNGILKSHQYNTKLKKYYQVNIYFLL